MTLDQKIPKIYKNVNPRQTANFLSIATFFYAIPIFRKAWKKDLEETDIYTILNRYKSNKLGDKLENAWQTEKSKSKPSLFRAMLRVFGLEYLTYGFLHLTIDTAIMVVRPLAFGKLVSYFVPNQTTVSKEEAYIYATIVIASRIGAIFFNQLIYLALQQLALKVRVATCSLIYRKSLKISDSTIGEITSGKVVTFITKDVHLFDGAVFFLNDAWVCSIQVAILMYVMYRHIQMSAFVGVGIILLMIPIQFFMGRKASQCRVKTVEKTDQRIRLTQEILTAMKIIKMYTWEKYFNKIVADYRRREIKHLRTIFYLVAMSILIGVLSQRFSLYITIVSYIYYFQNHMTAEKAYVIVGCYEILSSPLIFSLPMGVLRVSQAMTALTRITKFLLTPEVKPEESITEIDEKPRTKLVFENTSLNVNEKTTLIRDINLEIKNGVTALTGNVGVGKSTLLKLILKDRTASKGSVKIIGTVSYASQEPWIFPGTVRQNILFGLPYESARYQKIVKVCSLERDFAQLAAGDSTRLTDHGLNLSKGQKARVNLARAIYKKADIYLLDDPLSSVDAQVAQNIFQQCIQIFLKNKISILVTHQKQILKEMDNILLIENQTLNYVTTEDVLEKIIESNEDDHLEQHKQNGTISELNNLLKQAEMNEKNELAPLNTDSGCDAKGLYKEIKKEGQVNAEVYRAYINAGGGFKVIFVLVLLAAAMQLFSRGTEYVISRWVDVEQKLNDFIYNNTINTTEYHQTLEKHTHIMYMYSGSIALATISSTVVTFSYFAFSSKASVNLHKVVFSKVMDATMYFFDVNLSGIILNRFSKDIGNIDDFLPNILYDCIRVTLSLVVILAMIATVNPWFLVPSACFAILLYFMRLLYLPASRSIKRLEASTRSPVIGHLNASLEGLTTIRASQVEKILIAEFDRHQDLNSSSYYMYLTAMRAFAFCLDMLCVCYISMIILSFLVFDMATIAGKVGLAISQSFHMSGVLQWGTRQWAELENQMTSVERVYEYAKLKSEDKTGEQKENWPKEGRVEYRNVKLRYTQSGDYVLNNISFVIEPRQKIGVVGRTGAGKSSIISTLFKLYDFEGSIIIDDVEIKQLESNLLRSKISIIPQDPVLFTGSLRSNIDPNNEYSDELLWKALEDIEMKTTIANSDGGLNCEVHEGGSNFSVGQRQLLCLVRAILRNNKVLILDEATANIDENTDALIQRTIKNNFAECTVITVAHRLQTIMDSDKVMVMDAGCVLEYDEPETLLLNKNGWFYKLVEQAGLLSNKEKSVKE